MKRHPILVVWKLAFFVLLGLSLGGFNIAYAEFGLSRLSNPLPVGNIFPTPLPIVFPGFNTAAGVNASALPFETATAVNADFSPPLQTGDPMQFFGSLASSRGRFGAGLGYQGSSVAGSLTSGLFGGAAFRINPVSIGLGLRDNNLGAGLSPNVDLSTSVDFGAGIHFAAVLYHLDNAAQPDFGIGYSSGRSYHLEVNLLMPSLTNLTSNYTLTVAGGMNVGIFGLFFQTSFNTATSSFMEIAGVVFWLGNSFNITLQYTSPRTATAGFTLLF